MNMRRIGFLAGEGPWIAAFRDELRRLGYGDGENLTVETRVIANTLSDVAARQRSWRAWILN